MITKPDYRDKIDCVDYSEIKLLRATDGTSNTMYIKDTDEYFKECMQDGNKTPYWQDDQGRHTFLYIEEAGSFDDYAEVLSYYLAKNLGYRQKTDYAGNTQTVPMVNCAEYRLAEYLDIREYTHRGCISKSIAENGETLLKGVKILEPFKDPNRPLQKVRNSLANHKAALQIYKETQETITGREVILDPNIENDLLINAYMCYRISNGDNHSSNILYTQKMLPDGRILISVAPMIDNGSAWEMSNGTCLINHQKIVEKNTDENGNFVLTDSPFKAQAFHLDAGSLNGHSKKIDGKDLSQEFEFAAHALSNPEFYQAIFQIEQNFDLEQAYKELAINYRSNLPKEVVMVTTADSNLKASFMTQAMSNYFCYTAYKTCIGEVDEENPSELYSLFQSQMGELPLQENIQGYIDAFKNIAQSQNIEVSDEQLSTLNFLPQDDLSQTDDLAE